MIPLILQLDEQLKPGEEMIGIKTIPLKGAAPGHSLIGYVGIVKNSNNHGDIRHANLKAVQYTGKAIGDNII